MSISSVQQCNAVKVYHLLGFVHPVAMEIRSERAAADVAKLIGCFCCDSALPRRDPIITLCLQLALSGGGGGGGITSKRTETDGAHNAMPKRRQQLLHEKWNEYKPPRPSLARSSCSILVYIPRTFETENMSRSLKGQWLVDRQPLPLCSALSITDTAYTTTTTTTATTNDDAR